ncbi:unnamed protein product [Nezara viridula]|uniref:Uncharacterized protein n=1 Tax=Nezara viridula TaxID=85310 RepID=A0A9P0HSH7_NEZVI|nr:unnamed protein product [Nezara viridula]
MLISGVPTGKRSSGSPKRRWEDYIEADQPRGCRSSYSPPILLSWILEPCPAYPWSLADLPPPPEAPDGWSLLIVPGAQLTAAGSLVWRPSFHVLRVHPSMSKGHIISVRLGNGFSYLIFLR